MDCCDVFIVGGGAAGLAAARAAAQQGCKSILLVDRAAAPGGILRQCLHRGFGQERTGPEFIRCIMSHFPEEVSFCWNTSVLSVNANRTAVLSSPEFGLKKVRFRQMILASGCREIPFGSLQIAGTRPDGIFTAGQLQRSMNLEGFVPQGPAVILGGGDMGLVMAWQLLNAGVEVKMLVDQRENCRGIAQNRKRLEAYALPMRMQTTVSRVCGDDRLEGVYICSLTSGAREYIPCKTLVIAAGLTPDQKLIQNLGSHPWLRLCGNCRRIHGVVEGVVQEGIQAGIAACEILKG